MRISIIYILFVFFGVVSANDDVIYNCPYEAKKKCLFDIKDIKSLNVKFLTEKGEEVFVDINFTKANKNLSQNYWGADKYTKPQHMLSNIKITWSSKDVYLPATSFLGLANVHSVQIYSIGSGFHLLIKGGDAGTAYTATLGFFANRLTWRKIVGNSFPEVVWESAVYSHF